jgi:hypothetical protein
LGQIPDQRNADTDIHCVFAAASARVTVGNQIVKTAADADGGSWKRKAHPDANVIVSNNIHNNSSTPSLRTLRKRNN